MSATSTAGACTKKIDSQPSSCVRIPPTAGPSAAPAMPARIQMRAAEASDPVAWLSRSSAAQTIAAPATPCSARPATSQSNEGVSAQSSDAAAKTTTPMANVCTGRRRATNAAGNAETASARLNEVSTHASVEISTSYWARISGSAIVTTDESASTIPTERASSTTGMRTSGRP